MFRPRPNLLQKLVQLGEALVETSETIGVMLLFRSHYDTSVKVLPPEGWDWT